MKENQFLFKFWYATIPIFAFLIVLLFVITNPISKEEITINLIIIFAFFILYFSICFQFKLESTKIFYRLFPFGWKFKCLSFDEVEYYTITEYNFFTYGGLGKKINFTGATAYVVSGNKAFTFYLKNGKRLVLSIVDFKKAKEIIGIDKYREEILNS